jgi:hypothetical protein
MSFLTFSPLTKLSKYTLFALAGLFSVFAVWAAFGFSYPSPTHPLETALNDISKVMSFITAITLFIDVGKGGRRNQLDSIDKTGSRIFGLQLAPCQGPTA